MTVEDKEKAREALEAAFEDWRADNYDAHLTGHPGDVLDLFARLKAAAPKELTSS
jgi:hypothetical protein